MKDSAIVKAYQAAKSRYAEFEVDTDKAIKTLSNKSISIHCWQGDDVGGFERPEATLSGGGIQATGNYPGKARTLEELRKDLEKALSLIPGKNRVNLHAIYGEFGGKAVDRDDIEVTHFQGWIDWAKRLGIGLDFNGSFFSHPKAAAGFTLASKDKSIRKFWIEHAKRCREITYAMGKALSSPAVHNLWIPDGMKDVCVDRFGYRSILKDSLDEIYAIKYDGKFAKDAVESKLFGIGSESFVVGSHEFYFGYALKNGLFPCLDMGHFHPTESIADKISSLLLFFPNILMHVSRGIRWDSDHVVINDDATREVMAEIIRSDSLDKVFISLDYFDASLNRVGAWVTGARATQKALLSALCEPISALRKHEDSNNLFARLALLDEFKSLPLGAVWDYFCMKNNAPMAEKWIEEVLGYEKKHLLKRR